MEPRRVSVTLLRAPIVDDRRLSAPDEPDDGLESRRGTRAVEVAAAGAGAEAAAGTGAAADVGFMRMDNSASDSVDRSRVDSRQL